MRIGTIGAGFIARAVATAAIRHGHEVMVSNTRTPDTLFSVTASIGCKAGTPAEAASFGEIALLAIPLKNYHSIPLLPLEGKIVIDANNYYPQRDGRIAELDRNETTTSELLARHLPKSNIVKAFNAIRAADIVDDGRPAGSPKRRAHPIAGNDAAAKEVVTRLLEEFGFDVVDAGALAEGWRFQKDTPAYCVRLDSNELKRALVAAPIALQPQS